ncbi:ubiquitin system component Cue domain containing protein [Heterostelium album PN500]|uniref:Ubiquitin system component Cue domain containing protein n=1 Tax=Heterostelium pallidum (strain ATCC 26659 / Pp 5 / PN500) TaxID=670386 RepID=D3BN23_HETP5|nr:ubiquitin system component Cue domain containing protein [Heterostelium album PN500]EFA77385.1 ubiquitin system component Cue domain containing protein [Heterostelium album PN500]|eukprot:XP_020429514.1 ubiquitin system component Cue domain containing protein [Heterostelium album PN500]
MVQKDTVTSKNNGAQGGSATTGKSGKVAASKQQEHTDNTPKQNVEHRDKIKIIRDVTAWTEEEDIIKALTECKFDVNLTIDYILGGVLKQESGQWQEVKKRGGDEQRKNKEDNQKGGKPIKKEHRGDRDRPDRDGDHARTGGKNRDFNKSKLNGDSSSPQPHRDNNKPQRDNRRQHSNSVPSPSSPPTSATSTTTTTTSTSEQPAHPSTTSTSTTHQTPAASTNTPSVSVVASLDSSSHPTIGGKGMPSMSALIQEKEKERAAQQQKQQQQAQKAAQQQQNAAAHQSQQSTQAAAPAPSPLPLPNPTSTTTTTTTPAAATQTTNSSATTSSGQPTYASILTAQQNKSNTVTQPKPTPVAAATTSTPTTTTAATTQTTPAESTNTTTASQTVTAAPVATPVPTPQSTQVPQPVAPPAAAVATPTPVVSAAPTQTATPTPVATTATATTAAQAPIATAAATTGAPTPQRTNFGQKPGSTHAWKPKDSPSTSPSLVSSASNQQNASRQPIGTKQQSKIFDAPVALPDALNFDPNYDVQFGKDPSQPTTATQTPTPVQPPQQQQPQVVQPVAPVQQPQQQQPAVVQPPKQQQQHQQPAVVQQQQQPSQQPIHHHHNVVGQNTGIQASVQQQYQAFQSMNQNPNIPSMDPQHMMQETDLQHMSYQYPYMVPMMPAFFDDNGFGVRQQQFYESYNQNAYNGRTTSPVNDNTTSNTNKSFQRNNQNNNQQTFRGSGDNTNKFHQDGQNQSTHPSSQSPPLPQQSPFPYQYGYPYAYSQYSPYPNQNTQFQFPPYGYAPKHYLNMGRYHPNQTQAYPEQEEFKNMYSYSYFPNNTDPSLQAKLGQQQGQQPLSSSPTSSKTFGQNANAHQSAPSNNQSAPNSQAPGDLSGQYGKGQYNRATTNDQNNYYTPQSQQYMPSHFNPSFPQSNQTQRHYPLS